MWPAPKDEHLEETHCQGEPQHEDAGLAVKVGGRGHLLARVGTALRPAFGIGSRVKELGERLAIGVRAVVIFRRRWAPDDWVWVFGQDQGGSARVGTLPLLHAAG